MDDPLYGTIITLNDNIKLVVEDWWWDDDRNFFVKDKNTGDIWKFANCWPKSIKFEGLDSDSSEDCFIELKVKYSEKEYAR